MTNLNVKSQIAAADYERIRGYLQHAIPGGAPGTEQFGAVSDQMVDAFVMTLWKEYKPAYAQLGVPAPPAGLVTAAATAPAAHGLQYYAVDARHHRHGFSDFTATIPMVRLTLPADEQSYSIETRIGLVLASDHLLRNQRDVVAKAYPCERVELITPARRDGVRFAAIAVYLAYEHSADVFPKYYILEAGLAQGGPRMTYIAKDMQPIVRRADYVPTQFSSSNNFYRGTMGMDGNEPTALTIESMTTDPRTHAAAQPYVTITATFHKAEVYDNRLDVRPVQLYREAVIRVAAIAEERDQKVPDLSVFQGLFAQDGMSLEWLTKPKK
jgi:hypothetical protein